jgi:T5SS/PEP-CTERM-associated repeat protein
VGVVNIVGDGTTWTGSGFFEVGRFGKGTLNVTSGADVSMHDGVIGTDAGSVGVMNLGGAGTTWTGSGYFEVGRFGQGTLNVDGGAALTSANGRIALGATAIGSSANLNGFGSSWTTSDFLIAGEGSSGALVVSEGAAVNVGTFLYVGNNPGVSGTLDLSGAGSDPESPGTLVPSTVTTASQFIVGNLGNGSALVYDGARLVTNKAASVTGASGVLARFANSQGSVIVRGANSIWTGDGGVNVGFRGAGTLNIQEGARVESVDGVLARLPGSAGTATLSGNDSAWFIQNALYVGGRPASAAPDAEGTAGPGGTAHLSVGAGAYVTVGNSIETFAAGTINVSAAGSVTVGEGDPKSIHGALHVYTTGSLAGSGTIDGNLLNQGSVSPGNSPGVLTIDGAYDQSPSGALLIEIGGTVKGTQYDSLDISQNAMLGGSLNVSLVNGFSPAVGNAFEVLTADAGASGTFTSQVLPALAGGLSWSVVYGSNLVLLQVTSATLTGDYNGNGVVDAADYVVWRESQGSQTGYNVWRNNFGRTAQAASAGLPGGIAVPEPAALVLIFTALLCMAVPRCRSASHCETLIGRDRRPFGCNFGRFC